MALSKAQAEKWDGNFKVGGGKVTGLSGRMAARSGRHNSKSKAGKRAERVQQSKQGNGKTVSGTSVTTLADGDFWL
jgi:hypothetical protein